MVVVDGLDETRELRSLSNFLLIHRPFHAAGVHVDTRNNAMAIRVLASAVVMRLKDDGLLASVFALQHNDDFA